MYLDDYHCNPRQNIVAKLNFYVTPPLLSFSIVFLPALWLGSNQHWKQGVGGSAVAISKKMVVFATIFLRLSEFNSNNNNNNNNNKSGLMSSGG